MIIAQDTVWQSGTTHVLTDGVEIAAGATLTIEGGAEVSGGSFAGAGTLVIQGSADNRAILNETRFALGSDGAPGVLQVDFAQIYDVNFDVTGAFSIRNSVLDGVSGVDGFVATADSELSHNVFGNTAGLALNSSAARIVVDHNVFDSGVALDIPVIFWVNGGIQQTLSYNSFIAGRPQIVVHGDVTTIDAAHNFWPWGTPAGLQHAPDLTASDPAAFGTLIIDETDSNVLSVGGGAYLYAGAGDDLIEVGGGRSFVDGGSGLDTLSFADASWSHVVTYDKATALGSVSASTGSVGVQSVERYAFLNGSLEFGDTASIGARVYGVYEALLGQVPDALSLEQGAAQLEGGATVEDLAAQLLASPASRLSSSTDAGSFVTQLYDQVLAREPDAGGLAYWTAALEKGGVSRADVATAFALSDEHIASLAPALAEGIFIPDRSASDIARLYEAVVGWLPDPQGLGFWRDTVAGGAPLARVTDALLSSPDGQADFGGLDNLGFVDQLYGSALGRHAEAAGSSFWTHLLDAGSASRADVATAIAESTEAQHHLAALVEASPALV